VYGMKESTLHYHFFGSKMKQYQHLEKDDAIKTMVTDFVQSVETKVYEYPEQWYNYYDFWQQ